MLTPPDLPLPAAGSELLQQVGLQGLVLLWHLQEQRLGELQPFGQLRVKESSHIRSTGINSTWLDKQAQGKTASLHNMGVTSLLCRIYSLSHTATGVLTHPVPHRESQQIHRNAKIPVAKMLPPSKRQVTMTILPFDKNNQL